MAREWTIWLGTLSTELSFGTVVLYAWKVAHTVSITGSRQLRLFTNTATDSAPLGADVPAWWECGILPDCSDCYCLKLSANIDGEFLSLVHLHWHVNYVCLRIMNSTREGNSSIHTLPQIDVLQTYSRRMSLACIDGECGPWKFINCYQGTNLTPTSKH